MGRAVTNLVRQVRRDTLVQLPPRAQVRRVGRGRDGGYDVGELTHVVGATVSKNRWKEGVNKGCDSTHEEDGRNPERHCIKGRCVMTHIVLRTFVTAECRLGVQVLSLQC